MGSHLDNLPGADEILRVGTEFLHARLELTAAHPLGYVKAKPTYTIRLIPHTEFTNYHDVPPSAVYLHSLSARQVCEFLQFLDAVDVHDLAASVKPNFDDGVCRGEAAVLLKNHDFPGSAAVPSPTYPDYRIQ